MSKEFLYKESLLEDDKINKIRTSTQVQKECQFQIQYWQYYEEILT
jgi:hypothetical protein